MANTLKYKDLSGVVHTVDFDPSYSVRADVEATTEWAVVSDDPTVIPQLTTFTGGHRNP